MAELPTVTVDVRDMLCAQALAVVAHAMTFLQEGETLGAVYNTEDVKKDLGVWAKSQGHVSDEIEGMIVRITRSRRDAS